MNELFGTSKWLKDIARKIAGEVHTKQVKAEEFNPRPDRDYRCPRCYVDGNEDVTLRAVASSNPEKHDGFRCNKVSVHYYDVPLRKGDI